MIDDGLPGEWDLRVREACGSFKQGHLVAGPPFFYVASAAYGIYVLTRDFGDPSQSDELFETTERPPYGLITSESCDVSEEDARRPRHPWISVAPVYDLTNRIDASQLVNLREHRVQYMRLLDPPDLPQGLWVADLRIEVPLEKSWLVGREPTEAFRTLEGYDSLARLLAARRERPVISGDVQKALVRPLRRWVERMTATRRLAVLAGVAEVRISFAGSPLDPDAASLLVLGDRAPISAEVRAVWEAKWESWKDAMDQAGVPLLSMEFETLDSCTARGYLDSYQIDLSFAL